MKADLRFLTFLLLILAPPRRRDSQMSPLGPIIFWKVAPSDFTLPTALSIHVVCPSVRPCLTTSPSVTVRVPPRTGSDPKPRRPRAVRAGGGVGVVTSSGCAQPSVSMPFDPCLPARARFCSTGGYSIDGTPPCDEVKSVFLTNRWRVFMF